MIQDTSPQKNVLSSLIWKSAERFVSQGVSFVVSIILARLLLPEDYGVVAMALVFISFADVFANTGLSTALVQKKDAKESDFSTVFYCSLLVSMILYGTLYILAPLISSFYNDGSMTVLIRVFAIRVPLSVLLSVQQAYISRHMLFERLFWSTLGGTLLSGLVGIVLAFWGFGVWALVAQYFANTIANTIVLLVTVPWRPQLLFSWKSARQLISYGWKILAANLSGTFFAQLRSLLVGKFYTSADLAHYNKGQQFPMFLYHNLGGAIMAVLFPALSDYSDDIARVKEYTRRAEKTIVFILLPLMFGMAAVAEEFIIVLLGTEWIGCIPFLQILSVSCAVEVFGIAQFEALKAIGRSDAVLKLEFIKKPMYLLLLLAGLKTSVEALAVTMVLYNIYGVLVNNSEASKHIDYKLKEQLIDIIPVLLLSIFMMLSVMFVSFPVNSILLRLCLKILLGIMIYVCFAALLKLEPYVFLVHKLTARFKG